MVIIVLFGDFGLVKDTVCWVGFVFLKFGTVVLFLQGNLELVSELNARLKVCIKWFQKRDESHVEEEGKLQIALDALEKKCTETGILCSFNVSFQYCMILCLSASD